MPRLNRHADVEERSIALHRAIAAKLRDDASLVVHARERLHAWLEEGLIHPHYADAWLELLDQPLETVANEIVSGSQRMRDLRQCTPFTDVLDPRERWRILEEVNRQMERP